MKISYNWLKDYIDIPVSPELLSGILTGCGLEVEELAQWESVRGGLEGVVIGEVIHKEKHPDADKLSVTKVKINNDTVLQIVCGAPNVEAGQKVAVALIGTKLFKGEESWEIKRAKIRGVESEGMICAEDELGLGTSHDGIMVLQNDAPVGTPMSEFMNITRDWVFTIGLTPNRIDAASHFGAAMDIAAVINASDNAGLKVNIPDLKDFSIDNEDLPVVVEVDDAIACPRYSGITVKDLKIAPSPEWLANRLSAAGMRPINNVVDITNYVMLETGQPLHAFDLKHVRGNKIIVRKFSEKVEFETLDQVKRTIQPDDLMICNSNDPMCIAGVFGGLSSGVTDSTTEIFIESAYFNPVSVRRTSHRHTLKTESSFRFERGTDPSMTVYALKRAALMLKEIAGGTISSEIFDVYPNPIEKNTISLTFDFVNKLIGHTIEKETQLSILRDLDFEITRHDDTSFAVKVPYAKVDVTRPADVVEEILRIFGYNNIPFPEQHKTSLSLTDKTDVHVIQNNLSEILTGMGFFEIMTNSLSSQKYYVSELGFSEEENVMVLNPLSNELNTMRRSLVFSGLESLVYNINRKQQDLRMFEFGKIYRRKSSNKTLPVGEQFHEELKLGMFMTGKVFPLNWKYAEEELAFFHLKSIVHQVLLKTGIEEEMIDQTENNLPIFKYGLNYTIRSTGAPIVFFGELSEKVLERTECRQKMFYAEFGWENLMSNIANQSIRSVEPSRFPEVRRDISLLLDKEISYSEILNIIKSTGDKLIHKVDLFDIYEGKNIAEGKKSYAISIILQDIEKTLTDVETDRLIDRVKQAIVKHTGAIIR